MSEQELIEALRHLIANASSDAPDPRTLVREISRSDQRRIRLLASLSIFFWLLAAAGLVLLLIGLHLLVLYVRNGNVTLEEMGPATRQVLGLPIKLEDLDANAKHSADERLRRYHQDQMLHGTQLLHKSIPIITGSVAAMFLAALCTVLLVTASRRTTLRQISISLMELSEQVKQLRGTNAPAKPLD